MRSVHISMAECVHISSILNESHFDIRAQSKLLSATSAELVLQARVRALREGDYYFALTVPTPNSGGGPQSTEISGTLAIKALADPLRSDIDFSAAMPVLSHLDSAQLQITARDVDGYLINRGDKQIVVIVSREDGSVEHDEFWASFNTETGACRAQHAERACYEAVVKNLDMVGEYIVGLQHRDGTSMDKGVRFTIECSSGFEPNSKGKCKCHWRYCRCAPVHHRVATAVPDQEEQRVQFSKELVVSLLQTEGLMGIEIAFETWCATLQSSLLRNIGTWCTIGSLVMHGRLFDQVLHRSRTLLLLVVRVINIQVSYFLYARMPPPMSSGI